MSLRHRLETLRREAGAEPAVPSQQRADASCSAVAPTPAEALGQAPDARAIAERIQRLRLGSERACRPRLDPARLAERLGGVLLGEHLIHMREHLPWNVRHGRYSLNALREPLRYLPGALEARPTQWLFMDTETSGLAGGAGTLVWQLGLARLVEDGLELHQYLLCAFAGEARLYQELAGWLEPDGHWVSYNGKSFDLPLLHDRARLQRQTLSMQDWPHLDLLHSVRRAFGRHWPDCRLATAERRLLGFHRQDDLPGSEAPQVWFDLLQRGDASRVPALLRHNRHDLLSLALLLPALEAVHADPRAAGADSLGLARECLRRGEDRRALLLLRDAADQDEPQAQRELALYYRRQGDWAQALALWGPLAARGCSESLEALAKHAEHQAGDPARALELAHKLPPGPEREHRIARLRRKLATVV